jgi:hypothetical protein
MSDGQTIWESEKLEMGSYCLKVFEKEKKILVGMYNGKGAFIKY